MAGEVAGKGGGDEVRPLIGNPGIGMDPFYAAVLGGRMCGRPRPGEDGDFSGSQTSVASGCYGGGGDQFDLVSDQGQSVDVVGRQAGIARLAKPGQIANDAHGT